MNEDQAFLMLFLGISMTVNAGLALAWFRASRRVRRMEDQLWAPRGDERSTERLEQAVDALTSQVEQLSSGQEFLSRLVAQRAAERLPESRVVTPH